MTAAKLAGGGGVLSANACPASPGPHAGEHRPSPVSPGWCPPATRGNLASGEATCPLSPLVGDPTLTPHGVGSPIHSWPGSLHGCSPELAVSSVCARNAVRAHGGSPGQEFTLGHPVQHSGLVHPPPGSERCTGCPRPGPLPSRHCKPHAVGASDSRHPRNPEGS